MKASPQSRRHYHDMVTPFLFGRPSTSCLLWSRALVDDFCALLRVIVFGGGSYRLCPIAHIARINQEDLP